MYPILFLKYGCDMKRDRKFAIQDGNRYPKPDRLVSVNFSTGFVNG
jgi:hypothetical protein